MPAPTLLRVFKKARARDQAQITVDPHGKSFPLQTQQETWQVIYDSPVDQLTAQSAAGLPVPGLWYNGMTCIRKQPIRSTDSPNVWDVLIEYQQQLQVGTGNTWNVNIRKSSASREETATRDRLDLPLVNTVGELLPQLPNNTFYDDVYTITWTTKIAPAWGAIEGKTNSDSVTFTICGITRNFTQGQMKCTAATFGSTKITNGVTGGTTPTFTFNYDCELVFQIRKPKWVWSAPNEGTRGYNGSDVLDTFRDPPDDPQGVPRSQPTKMDLEGHELTSGVPLKLPDDAIGAAIPNGCRTYDANGAFELEQQTAFSGLFTGLND